MRNIGKGIFRIKICLNKLKFTYAKKIHTVGDKCLVILTLEIYNSLKYW
jgi:hypothetical protein